MFNTIKKERLADEIVRQIKAGKLQPGDRLPTERNLAAQFETSRTSVREAMRALEQAAGPGRGSALNQESEAGITSSSGF